MHLGLKQLDLELIPSMFQPQDSDTERLHSHVKKIGFKGLK